MTPYLSLKIRNLSAVAILMVLYIHMYYTEGATMPTLGLIEKIAGAGLCSVAVPLFYIISGYLFFLKVPDGVRSIAQKLRKRVRTLLIPYLIANILTFIFYVLLDILADALPALGAVVNFRVLDTVANDGFLPTLKLVFIDPPIAFQLWFVRDLMVVMLFSPLIYFATSYLIRKRAALIIPAILAALFVITHNGYIISFVWFSLGGYIAMTGLKLEGRPKVWIASVLVAVYTGISVYTAIGSIPSTVTRFIPVIGIPAIWLAYDIIADRPIRYSASSFLTEYTFFVYLIHEPLLNIFKKLPLLISREEPMLIVSYIIIPPLFFISACLFGKALRHLTPRFYRIYTGDR